MFVEVAKRAPYRPCATNGTAAELVDLNRECVAFWEALGPVLEEWSRTPMGKVMPASIVQVR
jgi:hypothetical protein